MIVIESESESVNAIENQAAYVENISSGEVGLLSQTCYCIGALSYNQRYII